jgi:transcriptional regulator with XRE-family HTH domain
LDILIIFGYFLYANMDTSGERLKQLIELQGLNMRKFCEKFDIPYTSFQQMTANKREIGMVTLWKLIEIFPDLNLNWLVLGKGPKMLSKYDYTKLPEKMIEESVNKESDIVENAILKYLSKETVRNSFKSIVKEVLNEKTK